VFLTSALSCQGLVNKDLSQKISIINSLKWKPVPGSTYFLSGVLESCNQLVVKMFPRDVLVKKKEKKRKEKRS